MYVGLLRHCEAKGGVTTDIANLRRIVKNLVKEKFELNDYHVMGAYLDPRQTYKLRQSMDSKLGEAVAVDLWSFAIDGKLHELMQNFKVMQDEDDVSEEEQRGEDDEVVIVPNNNQCPNPNSVFDDSDEEDEHVVQPKSEIEKFVSAASNVPSNYKNFDILMWWKTNEAQFPLLAKVARSILCIPASSAESERVFSAASSTVTEKCTRILTKNLDGLITIESNIRFLRYD